MAYEKLDPRTLSRCIGLLMKVTGYQLRDALSSWTLRKEAAEKLMPHSFFKFPNEEKKTPEEVADALTEAEASIVTLQVAQARFNLAVKLSSPTLGEVSLGAAIKLLGATNRVKKFWSDAVAPPKRRRYESAPAVEIERDPTRVRAEATMKPEEITKKIAQASKKVSHLGALIATGNLKEVEIEGLDASLFE